jgi:peptidoglycan hydrolase-like protein with peptidoglycan-binding domain
MTQHNNNLSLNQQGKDVAFLQSRLNTIGYEIASSEIHGERFGESTQQAILHFQQASGLPATGIVDDATAQAIVARSESEQTVIKLSPAHHQATASTPIGSSDRPVKPNDNQAVDASAYTVSGTITSPDRAGVCGLRVQIVSKHVGPDVPLTETTTDGSGHYNARFTARSLLNGNKTQPDLQARVYAGQTFLAASHVHYNATTNETLNVNLPANSTALPSEYETLTSTLAAHYTGPLGEQ